MENKKFCKFCGKEIDKDCIVCPKCGRQLEDAKKIKKENKEEVNKTLGNNSDIIQGNNFYERDWFMILMLIIFTPVGIFLLWKFNKKYKETTKIILTAVFGLYFLIILGAAASDTSEDSDNGQSEKFDTNKKVTVEVVDFSSMTTAEVDSWCEEKKVNCKKTNEYSDTIEKGAFIKQSINSSQTIYEGEDITIVYSLGKEPTNGQKNALKSAKSYLNYSAFSRKGLIKQLEFEGYTNEEAVYGVDNVEVDWKEQAVKSAKSYLDYSSFSRKGLIEQLEFEGFTHEQAVYGVEQNGL